MKECCHIETLPRKLTKDQKRNFFISRKCSTCLQERNSVWLCLECDYVGCEKHVRSNHSVHALSVNLANFSLYCAFCSTDLGSQHALSHYLKFIQTKGLKGIANIGNTCFLSASLQCLSHTPVFQKLLRHIPPYSSHELRGFLSPQQKLVMSLRNFILYQWGGEIGVTVPSIFNPEPVLSAVQTLNSSFQGFQQHDSQEFLRFLLSTINESLGPGNPVNDVFMGKTCSKIKCFRCLKTSSCVEDFFDLSLPIPPGVNVSEDPATTKWIWQKMKSVFSFEQPAKASLTDCLKLFTRSETLSGSNAYFCETCKIRTDCTKEILIQKSPETLILHIKRFKHDWSSSKLNKCVSFPIESDLDLTPFVVDPTENLKYRLSGIVQHTGTISSGHYTAYCRHKSSGSWYCFDDSRVSLIPNFSLDNAEAYVLFFQRENDVELHDTLKEVPSDGIKNRNEIAYIPRKWTILSAPMDNKSREEDFKRIVCTHQRPSTTCPLHAKSLFVSLEKEYAVSKKIPFINSLETCNACEKFVSSYNNRLMWEQRLVSKLDSKTIPSDQVWYFLDSNWVGKWRQYLRSGQIADSNKACDPGPIKNRPLVDRIGKECNKLKITSDYLAVNRSVWTLFTHCHGIDGPLITNKSLELKNALISDSSEQTPILSDSTLVSDQEWDKIRHTNPSFNRDL